jgi:transcription antitermination factor NusG
MTPKVANCLLAYRRVERGWYDSTMSQPEWYALRVRRRFERIVAVRLEHQNIEHYLPLHRFVRQRSAARTCAIELPMLPEYVFCKASPEMQHSLLTFPGVLNALRDAPALERKIADLKRIRQSGLTVLQWPFTEMGYAVTVESGSLKGITGVLNSSRSEKPILIFSIDTIRRSLGVRLDGEFTFSSARKGAAA